MKPYAKGFAAAIVFGLAIVVLVVLEYYSRYTRNERELMAICDSPWQVTSIEVRGKDLDAGQGLIRDRDAIEAWCHAARKMPPYRGNRAHEDMMDRVPNDWVAFYTTPRTARLIRITASRVYEEYGPEMARCFESHRVYGGNIPVSDPLATKRRILSMGPRDVAFIRLWPGLFSRSVHFDITGRIEVERLLSDLRSVSFSTKAENKGYVQLFPTDERQSVLTISIGDEPKDAVWSTDFQTRWDKLTEQSRISTLKEHMK